MKIAIITGASSGFGRDRMDLVGYDKKCLIRPRQNKQQQWEKPQQQNKKPKKKKAIRNVHKKKNK